MLSIEERLKLLEEHLNSPEGKESLRKHFEEKERKEKEVTEFFESERFNEIYKELVAYLVEEECLTGFTMLHGNGVPFMTNKEFDRFTMSFFYNLESKEDEESCFPTTFIRYKMLKIEMVSGQGTEIVVSLNV